MFVTTIGGTMKRLLQACLVSLLAVAVIAALGGCAGDQTPEANAAIEASNAAVQDANRSDAEAVKLFEQIGKLQPGPESTDKAVELIAKAEKSVKDKSAALDTAIGALSKIESLNVSDDFKAYARQQIELADLQKESNNLLLAAIAEFKNVFETAGSSSPDTKALQASFTKIDEVFAAAERLSKDIDKKATISDEFFQEKGLGN